LIWLFPADQELEKVKHKIPKDYYYDLIRLFCYRNKVIWSYRESRKLKQSLTTKYADYQEIFQKINQAIKTRSYTLDYLRKQLADILKNISEYTDELTRLNAQSLTIKINLENYRKRLKKIQEKDPESDLNVLRKFIDYVNKKYQQEIEFNYAYFSPVVSLLESQINLIQGAIDIEQTQSERNLNELVAVASVGLGVGAITATVVVTQPPKNIPHVEYYFSKATFSILCGFAGAFLGYCLWKVYHCLWKVYLRKNDS
jgi:hypothetical protein